MPVLPEEFIQFMRDVYGTEAANAWFQRLPSLLEECAERWRLKLLPPFEHLSFHSVALAVRADGTLMRVPYALERRKSLLHRRNFPSCLRPINASRAVGSVIVPSALMRLRFCCG